MSDSSYQLGLPLGPRSDDSPSRGRAAISRQQWTSGWATPSTRPDTIRWAAAMTDGDVSLDDAGRLVLAWLHTEPSLKESSKGKAEGIIRHFLASSTQREARQLEDLTTEIAMAFVEEPVIEQGRWVEVAHSTQRTRIWALKKFFMALRQLGFDCVDPTIDVVLGASTSTNAGPLTDREMAAVRQIAVHRLFNDRGPAAVALAEIGATTSEIARVHARLQPGGGNHRPRRAPDAPAANPEPE